MKREQVEQTLREMGWHKDTFGHFKKTSGGALLLRVKMQANSCRLEKQTSIGGRNEWIRMSSDYYTNIALTPQGNLKIGTKLLLSKRN